MSYQVFAEFYDVLTKNINYYERAERYVRLLKSYDIHPGLLLDLACGTGSLSIPLSQMGFSVIGTDASADMLSQAQMKAMDAGCDILFLCQQMEKLDLYGSVGCVICALDSLNHLRGVERLGTVFEKVNYFLDPGGIFIFDVNTLYKHQKVLANNTFVYETKDVMCVWRNSLSEADLSITIELDFFRQQSNRQYLRSREVFREYSYPVKLLCDLLHNTGFELLALHDDQSEKPPHPQSEKIEFIARKSVI